MTVDIKYTVKYHPRSIKKIGNVFFGFTGLILFVLDLIWLPFRGLTPDLQALVIFYLIPKLYWDFHIIAAISLAIGTLFWLFRWRPGRMELTDEKLIIQGSYLVSIWLKNMWEIDIRDLKFHRWRIRLDSNVDAVQIKFKTEKEFEEFSSKLVSMLGQFDSVKLKTTT